MTINVEEIPSKEIVLISVFLAQTNNKVLIRPHCTDIRRRLVLIFLVLSAECLFHRKIERTLSRHSTPEKTQSERRNGNVIISDGMYTTYYTNGNGSCDNLSLNKYQDQEGVSKFYEKNREIFLGNDIYLFHNYDEL